ncbi:MAG: flavohemoglobin expression-modulating QEGLA motif protein [Gammaproteobacteria bacterium]
MKIENTIRELSDRIVTAQAPIRILDAIKWGDDVREEFFKHRCQRLPVLETSYYEKNALPFNVEDKLDEFSLIINDAKNQLGETTQITRLIVRRCEDYCKAIEMLRARGTKNFLKFSRELYGAPEDAFYPGGPRLSELSGLLGNVLESLTEQLCNQMDEKRYTAEQALELLQARLSSYFTEHKQAMVVVSDNIVADAAAGADVIKLNQNVLFSERDIRYLEVHEGWVHVGTTLNGMAQPYCTFLGKGSPGSTVTQEGLAVLTEILTFSSSPARLQRITNRVKALELASDGADFMEIFRFFKGKGYDDNDAYNYSVRVFRGSLPSGIGPFTKDLSYARGFVLLYNYIRLAVRENVIRRVPLFFVGKTLVDEMHILNDVYEQGYLMRPKYLPQQFKDLAALSSWMSLSLYLNKFDLDAVAKHYEL